MESYTADLVVVGAGAAGLLAAAAARRLGDQVIVVEASGRVGGSTSATDGAAWLPANPIMVKAGTPDSAADAARYLEALLGAPADANAASQRAAFIKTAPKLARWLASSNVPLHVAKGAGDLHPDLPGAQAAGRAIQAGPIDRRLLGETDSALARATGLVREALAKLPLPRRTATGGESLVAHLLHRAVANGVELWLDTPVTALRTTDGRISAVVVDRDGVETEISTARVVLAAGGFEANAGLRDEYLPLPTDAAWTTASGRNYGDLLAIAEGVGAATTNLADAWWQPVMVVDGTAYPVRAAIHHPHSVLVDAAGDRYIDETRSDDDLGLAMYDHSRGVRAVPSYLIGDNRHRQTCALGPWTAGNTPRQAIEDGDITRAASLNDLAQATGLDRAGILGTVVRFNSFAAKGTDSDFNRGRLEASGKSKRKNPSLGKLDKPPFWAVKVYPGDAGTKGGLVTDSSWRVLRSDNTVIEGLYACAGTAASIFPGAAPADGAALGESLVAAFLAATDQRSERRREL
jgi:succinate dehydrogenase/fumarate reductase flavoprotein subunit